MSEEPQIAAVCELKLYSRKPLSGKGKGAIYPTCGAAAVYRWKSRSGRADMILCRACGSVMAGNFTDELTLLS